MKWVLYCIGGKHLIEQTSRDKVCCHGESFLSFDVHEAYHLEAQEDASPGSFACSSKYDQARNLRVPDQNLQC